MGESALETVGLGFVVALQMLLRLGDRDDAAGPGGSEIDLPSRSHAGDREKAPEGEGVRFLVLMALLSRLFLAFGRMAVKS